EVSRADLASVNRAGDVFHSDNSPSVLSVACVIKIELARVTLRNVLEISVLARDRVINRRLIVFVERERLRKASVLGSVDLATRHQRKEVILDRRRVDLLRKSRGAFASPRKTDAQSHPVNITSRYHFAPTTKRK